MMSRTQISVETEVLKRAKARAAELGISFAEYVRRLVDRDLGTGERRGDISIIFDMGDSGRSDVSGNIHKYVGEAVEAEYLKDVGDS